MRRDSCIVDTMDTPKRHPATRMIWPVLPLLFSACGSLSDRSAQTLPQASDSATGGTQLLASTVRATALSTVRQPYTTVRTGLAILWHRPLGVVSGNVPLPTDILPQPPEVPGTEEFERLLDQRRLPHRESGKLTWLVDGPGFFPELDRQLAAAKQV